MGDGSQEKKEKKKKRREKGRGNGNKWEKEWEMPLFQNAAFPGIGDLFSVEIPTALGFTENLSYNLRSRDCGGR